ncbi:hypothetical protein ANCCEY_04869 [Ancylostoma ceylanicum]|uniref:DUF19 domain-containing protein n=1 Tax=Ancylostoma ceylanicum TaxID=53326 RepID=A0A0D6LXU8_9BILA|nr:hypothetical protein ANCCEY_04869 [Ancylostoma ceylanicum]
MLRVFLVLAARVLLVDHDLLDFCCASMGVGCSLIVNSSQNLNFVALETISSEEFSFFRLAFTSEEGERCGVDEERRVNECLQPMLDYAAKLQADTGAMQFPLQGGEVFKKLCSIFMDFKVEMEKSYVSCKTAATQAITEAQETKLQSGSTEAYLAEMCRAMDGYLRCSHPVILEKCGAEAWKLVSTVTRDSLGVTMPDCDMRSALI